MARNYYITQSGRLRRKGQYTLLRAGKRTTHPNTHRGYRLTLLLWTFREGFMYAISQ